MLVPVSPTSKGSISYHSHSFPQVFKEKTFPALCLSSVSFSPAQRETCSWQSSTDSVFAFQDMTFSCQLMKFHEAGCLMISGVFLVCGLKPGEKPLVLKRHPASCCLKACWHKGHSIRCWEADRFLWRLRRSVKWIFYIHQTKCMDLTYILCSCCQVTLKL